MHSRFDLLQLSMKMIGTLVASQSVIGARIRMFGAGTFGARRSSLGEFSRLIFKKGPPLRGGGNRAKAGILLSADRYPPRSSGVQHRQGLGSRPAGPNPIPVRSAARQRGT